MLCQHCGVPMRLVNQARGRRLLYWCPTCQRFAEVLRSA
jgi:formamidopyrimidine-DNA glycosylase